MAQADAADIYTWVTDLETGKPIGSAAVELIGGSQKATTGSDGLAHIPLSATPGKRLLVRKGDDSAFLPSSQWEYNDISWIKRGQSDIQRWFIFDDRKLYRPGEKARVKGGYGYKRRERPAIWHFPPG
jgi:uncharacterized protein YfaS (alpha-2-macroglobulin family)